MAIFKCFLYVCQRVTNHFCRIFPVICCQKAHVLKLKRSNCCVLDEERLRESYHPILWLGKWHLVAGGLQTCREKLLFSYVYIHIYIYKHTYIHICIHTYIYICIYIYVYICYNAILLIVIYTYISYVCIQMEWNLNFDLSWHSHDVGQFWNGSGDGWRHPVGGFCSRKARGSGRGTSWCRSTRPKWSSAYLKMVI